MKNRIINRKVLSNKCRNALAMSLAALLFTGCSFADNDADGRRISKNDPWFEGNIYDIDSGADKGKETESFNQYFAGADDKYLVVYTEGSYKQDTDRPTGFDGIFYGYVITIDRVTKEVVSTIDIESPSYKSSDEYIKNVYYSNGIITVNASAHTKEHDPLTGSVLSERKSSYADMFSSRIFKAGEYLIDSRIYWDGSICEFDLTAPGGKASTVKLEETDNMFFFITTIIPLNESEALVIAATQKGQMYYKLDLVAGMINKTDGKEYEWLNLNKLESTVTGSDGNLYLRTAGGISVVNVKARSVEDVFNYNWSDVNIGMYSGLEFVDCTGDSLVFIGQIRNISFYEDFQTDFQIVELSKASKNPNQGKTVLELYAPMLNMSIGDAITRYNDSNKKYHIEVVYRYDERDYQPAGGSLNISSWDEDTIFRLTTDSNLSNALITDIVAGKGPDILISMDSYGQLNNPDYLADLTPYVDSLDPELYYTNIIEGSKTNGAIYQMPIGFYIHGIYTDQSVAGSTGVGFTLDEYQAFVKDTLNGTDVIQIGQAVYFSELANYMDDKFIVDGKVNYDTPEFAQLAGYVKENVVASSVQLDEIPDAYWENLNYADSTSVQGIAEFFQKKENSQFFNEPTILGWPSIDGRGPMFETCMSVAVSAQAADIDACGEFISFLLAEDVQTGLAMNGQFVLNKNAFRSAGDKLTEFFNNGQHSNQPVSEDEKLTSKDLDNIERIILSCSKMNSENSDISMIIIEEMPAYFLDQKDLDSVIVIIQDRVQKVLDERG